MERREEKKVRELHALRGDTHHTPHTHHTHTPHTTHHTHTTHTHHITHTHTYHTPHTTPTHHTPHTHTTHTHTTHHTPHIHARILSLLLPDTPPKPTAAKGRKGRGKEKGTILLTALEQEMLEWALHGFLPTGPSGLKPTPGESNMSYTVLHCVTPCN